MLLYNVSYQPQGFSLSIALFFQKEFRYLVYCITVGSYQEYRVGALWPSDLAQSAVQI